jgi:hypothetical protein
MMMALGGFGAGAATVSVIELNLGKAKVPGSLF